MTGHESTPDAPDGPGGAEMREARSAAGRREEERAASRPFSYPYPERHANVRATRHISREQADADSTPGVPGGYGTTSGGQPGARSGVRPGHDDGAEEAGYPDTIAGTEPGPGQGEERP
ncbi:hypothetical protein RKE30_19240 [Streptomyces sp. Li-HN-5-11]|uniref:hypothetical protein n=1 Tax=Streptomyces sp. Li-HN-5-11 TaxID=3075432 RepID=UPI0028A5E5D8|nr:hypothetical protein [Streptomyces sp. Li-HN-5-11]WNM32394.1 hypothetical protein RKE30_19240 [Streptomyces sp. Li-HN-5-11]WOP38849.1 hypothetical protein RKE32_36375 [Streptomyces sp. Li-HN-5-13]